MAALLCNDNSCCVDVLLVNCPKLGLLSGSLPATIVEFTADHVAIWAIVLVPLRPHFDRNANLGWFTAIQSY